MSFRKNGYGPIDRFCAKHPRFGIPNLMKILVITQIVVYVVDIITQLSMGFGWSYFLYFIPGAVLQGQVWRLVTWLVLPNADNPFFLLISCYFYWWIASTLERQWGTARFNLFYLSGAVLSVVLGLVLSFLQPQYSFNPMDLSYYLNLSIFLIIATMFGEMRVLLFFIVPVKMKWMAIIDVALILIDMLGLFRMGAWAYALVPLASFINYFIFTWPFWSMKLGIVKRRADPTVINFKKAQQQAKKIEKTQQTQGYRHKCSVCGVTDAMEPDMEFRYCSKCDGYHCYCKDHINNHIHIHED